MQHIKYIRPGRGPFRVRSRRIGADAAFAKAMARSEYPRIVRLIEIEAARIFAGMYAKPLELYILHLALGIEAQVFSPFRSVGIVDDREQRLREQAKASAAGSPLQ